MKKNRKQSVAVALLAMSLGTFVLPGRTALAAADVSQYQQLLDQGQFQPLLKEVGIALAKKAPNKPDTEKYALLMIKGDALLHLKASSAAQDAYAAAALAATDDNSAAVARGTVVLIKRSGSSKYQPKAPADPKSDTKTIPEGIDIIDKNSRKDAFSSLFTDMFDPLKTQVAKVDTITSLDPLMEMATQAKDVHDVEIASAGSDPQTKDMLEKIATRAATLMTDALKPLNTQITAVTKDATKHQKQMGKSAPKNGFSDLTPSDADQLDSIVSTAEEVASAAGQMIKVTGDAGGLKTVETDAQKIVTTANKLLTQYKHPSA